MKEDTEDLQSFLDNFDKDIAKGSHTVVTLTADNVAALAGGNKAVQKILLDSANNGSDHNEGSDIVFYLEEDSSSQTEVETKPKQNLSAATKPSGSRVKRQAALKSTVNSKSPALSQRPNTRNFTMLNAKKCDPLYVDGKTADDDEDKPPSKKSRVYNFEENIADEVEELKDIDVDYVVHQKQIKLKQVSAVSTSSGNQFSCNSCDYKTNKKMLMQRHEKSHSEERPFKCSICERGFKNNVALVNHVNVHMGNRPHKCKDCESAFTTSGELVRHVRYKHTGEKPHKCTECGYASVEMGKLRRHIRCHTGERPYQCPHCTYASPDTFKLKRHLRTHTGEKPYECDICKARFTQSNSLKSHRLIHSVVDKPVFQCTLCPTTCGRKGDLRLHMQNLHQSDEPIQCSKCGKELPDRYNYKLHVKTHKGEKCYRCPLCAYGSISQRHLDSHMLIHTDEKPFKCEFCELEFRQHQLLKRHMNIYHNKDYVAPTPREKNNTCPHCKRTFARKGNLMRHMKEHDPTYKAVESKAALLQGRNVRIKPYETIVKISDLEGDPSDSPKMDDIEYAEEDNVEDEEMLTEDEEYVEFEERHQNSNTLQNNYKMPVPVSLNKAMNDAKDVITFRIKHEPITGEKDILTVDVHGEDQYVVLEVVNKTDNELNDDDNDDDMGGEGIIVETYHAESAEDVDPNNTDKTVSSRINAENCFGFEVDEDEDYVNEEYDVESKNFIRLLNM